MTHLSEERNIPAPADAIWRVIANTTRWPQFYATPREVGKLRMVEYLEGADADGPGVKRRLHFLGLPAWDEQVTRWRENEGVTWLGIRNPWQRYWTQQLELIPGRSKATGTPFTTLRWDIFYGLDAPNVAKKPFQRALEDIMLSSLARVERLAIEEARNGDKT